MKCNPRHESTVVTVASRRSEGAILAYADLLTAHRNARVAPVRLQVADPFVVPWGSPSGRAGNGFIRTAITQIARAEKVGMIVSEWLPDPHDMQQLLRLAHELAVPAVVIRHPEARPRGRLLVATAGGPGVLQQMWVARQTACSLDLPVSFLRVVHPAVTPVGMSPSDDPVAALDVCACRLLHMEARMEIKRAVKVDDAIASCVREGDLLVLGAPSALRMTSGFEESLPHVVAHRVSAPLILLSTPPNNRLSVRGLLWGGLIKTGLRPRDKKHALSALIENLACHNQIPRSSVGDTLDRALRREAIMSTAVDCETAFPHVTLRGFFGVAASMAICPEGVAFDSPDGRPTRFLYLLVTPDGFCDDYLAILAMVARRMINPEVRQALLACRSPAHALDILEPRPAISGRTESALPPCRKSVACEADELAEPPTMETSPR